MPGTAEAAVPTTAWAGEAPVRSVTVTRFAASSRTTKPSPSRPGVVAASPRALPSASVTTPAAVGTAPHSQYRYRADACSEGVAQELAVERVRTTAPVATSVPVTLPVVDSC